MGERTVRIRKVAGSIPVRSTKNAAHRFRLAKFVRPRFFHRGIIPLLTLFFSASGSQKTAVTPLEEGRQMPSGLPPPCGGQLPGVPRWLSGQAGTFFPLTTPPAGHKFVLNPCRKAHRSYSLFPIHYSLPTRSARRNLTPRQTRPTPRERQRIAPRRGRGLPYFMGI